MKESNTQTGIPFKVYSLLMPSDPLWPWTRIQYLLKMNQDLKKKKKNEWSFLFWWKEHSSMNLSLLQRAHRSPSITNSFLTPPNQSSENAVLLQIACLMLLVETVKWFHKADIFTLNECALIVTLILTLTLGNKQRFYTLSNCNHQESFC